MVSHDEGAMMYWIENASQLKHYSFELWGMQPEVRQWAREREGGWCGVGWAGLGLALRRAEGKGGGSCGPVLRRQCVMGLCALRCCLGLPAPGCVSICRCAAVADRCC